MTRLLSVVGARPNFMKVAALDRVLGVRCGVEHLIVHTGQHYDAEMSTAFFRDLGIPAPQHHLGAGSGTHAQQTAVIMQRFEPVCAQACPDLVLVYGDVNSTLAAALVAAKLGVRVAHVEAGLRSRDWAMPEEINRVVTDRLADYLFTPSRDADENLLAEGIPANRIHFVGNVMIDSLIYARQRASGLAAAVRYGVHARDYVIATLHRPSNVDDRETLSELLAALTTVAETHVVLFPLHPRTKNRMEALGTRVSANGRLRFLEPLGYLEMLSLVSTAGLVITDSGGLQEETTFLGVPCLTVRPNTERPITLTEGTNRLVRSTRQGVLDGFSAAWGAPPTAAPIERWDGRAAERIADVLLRGGPASFTAGRSERAGAGSPAPASEDGRIRAAYARRSQIDGRYSWADPAHVFRMHDLERRILGMVNRSDVNLTGSRRILEIGCGRGQWLRQVVKWGADPRSVVGIDLIKDRLHSAKDLGSPKTSLVCATAGSLPFPDAFFDLVMQLTVFSSILRFPTRSAVAAEMLRVLAPRGVIVWYDLAMDNPGNTDVRGVQRAEIRALFPQCDFAFQRVTLAPPLARALARYSTTACLLLDRLPLLRTHILALIRRPGPNTSKQHPVGAASPPGVTGV